MEGVHCGHSLNGESCHPAPLPLSLQRRGLPPRVQSRGAVPRAALGRGRVAKADQLAGVHGRLGPLLEVPGLRTGCWAGRDISFDISFNALPKDDELRLPDLHGTGNFGTHYDATLHYLDIAVCMRDAQSAVFRHFQHLQRGLRRPPCKPAFESNAGAESAVRDTEWGVQSAVTTPLRPHPAVAPSGRSIGLWRGRRPAAPPCERPPPPWPGQRGVASPQVAHAQPRGFKAVFHDHPSPKLSGVSVRGASPGGRHDTDPTAPDSPQPQPSPHPVVADPAGHSRWHSADR